MIKGFRKFSKNELLKLNKLYHWSLNEKELLNIREYFRKIGRDPTRAEMETIAQTWSEHCKHKTFNGPVEITIIKNKKRIKKDFKSLFKETIVYATSKLNKPYCLSVFKDNAGVIKFTENWALAFKVETHNHPCAIEPYGGAETGVGGVIRDILGVGLGAKPVLNTDVFCFAFPDKKYKIEKGFLSPHKIINGVVSGVRDYGNRMGIPTASGSVFFDDAYLYNPLVYVGCAGIMHRRMIEKKVHPGSLIVVIGGATGRDGIGGATFSSSDITETSSSTHVQIGNAIMEKKLLDVIMKARDENLYTAITDCGAGGFSSACGELARECGAVVRLENVILKDKDIQDWEIWLSESQERMVLCVEKKNIKRLKEICDIEDCPMYIIGEFRNDKRLKVYYYDDLIVDLDMDFLHDGFSKVKRTAFYKYKRMKNKISRVEDYSLVFKKVISDLNVRSKKWIIEQYDYEVIGQSVLKPFCGNDQSVPSDAVVIWPVNVCGREIGYKGFAVSCGIKPTISYISTYDMAMYAIDEAVRNLVCVGSDIEKAAMLDNFCAANPQDKRVMGEFVMAALAARDGAIEMKIPFISGKDSFYNQTKIGDKTYSIPLTLLISAISPVDDIRKIITPYFKKPDSSIYVAGRFLKGLGASVYSRIFQKDNNFISPIDLKDNRKMYLKLVELMKKGYILSAHDVSDGGLMAAVSEMCFNGVGVDLDISCVLDSYNVSDIEALFGECGSRIVIEVDRKFERDFEKDFKGSWFVKLGCTIEKPELIVRKDNKSLVHLLIDEIKLLAS